VSADYQPNRWRCLTIGCNPVLNEQTAVAHTDETGHRTAKWPVRSKAGRKAAKRRNRTGYYDKYNVGEKSAEARGLVSPRPERADLGGYGPMALDEMSDNDWGVPR